MITYKVFSFNVKIRVLHSDTDTMGQIIIYWGVKIVNYMMFSSFRGFYPSNASSGHAPILIPSFSYNNKNCFLTLEEIYFIISHLDSTHLGKPLNSKREDDPHEPQWEA